ncbi:hypothetical protein CHS0354_028985 [Potamilus streckersoni]|uniref:Uncharacterized protein n=1 Tax=Potamilus streckersoni TaxID=2493646 RepID=A0AAE0T6F9_9BIVA|nr:hypothetical protein CHS0354_028985 [Potamilus streckersoni]
MIQSNPDTEGNYPVKEVFPDMNDDESENRVVITLDHTLEIRKATTSDAGSYLCHDVTWRDRILENKVMTWTDIQKTFFDSGSLRFIYHVDGEDMHRSSYKNIEIYQTQQNINVT